MGKIPITPLSVQRSYNTLKQIKPKEPVSKSSSDIINKFAKSIILAGAFLAPTGFIPQAQIQTIAAESSKEISPEDYIKELSDGFKTLSGTPQENLETEALKFLTVIKKGDVHDFLIWYKNEITIKDKTETRQRALEVVGRLVIGDNPIPYYNPGENKTAEENAKKLSKILPIYAQVIKNNNHLKDFAINGLNTINPISHPGLISIKNAEMVLHKQAQDTSKKLADSILDVYEAALEGLPAMLHKPVDLKGLGNLIFHVPYNGEGFGDAQSKEEIKNGIIKEERVKTAHNSHM